MINSNHEDCLKNKYALLHVGTSIGKGNTTKAIVNLLRRVGAKPIGLIVAFQHDYPDSEIVNLNEDDSEEIGHSSVFDFRVTHHTE